MRPLYARRHAGNAALFRAQVSFGAAFAAEWAFVVGLGLVAYADGGGPRRCAAEHVVLHAVSRADFLPAVAGFDDARTRRERRRGPARIGSTTMREPVEQFCDLEGGVRLCYETIGSETDPPCLLVMGLGFQMIAWADAFCDQLAAHGLRVIRFDNRDSGRSTHLSDARAPSLRELATRRIREPAYTLEDMARDAAGLLDHLGIDRAHVVGVSMGSMISQTLAAQSPERVRSLTSIMGSTGALLTGQPSMRILPLLLRPQAKDRARYVAQGIAAVGRIGSAGFPSDEHETRELLERTFDRGVSGASFARQLGAIIASGNRVKALRRIEAPTLVVHGKADRLVTPSGGRATARAIKGADLLLLDGMGHDLPRQLWPLLVGAIVGNAERAG